MLGASIDDQSQASPIRSYHGLGIGSVVPYRAEYGVLRQGAMPLTQIRFSSILEKECEWEP